MIFIWKDPVKWSEKTIGKNFTFWFMIFTHLIGSAGLISMPVLILLGIGFSSVGTLIYAVTFIMFAAILPISYLYALKKLLIELKKDHK